MFNKIEQNFLTLKLSDTGKYIEKTANTAVTHIAWKFYKISSSLVPKTIAISTSYLIIHMKLGKRKAAINQDW